MGMGLILGCVAALAGAPPSTEEAEGTWRLAMPRPGWFPAVCRGELKLEREGERWRGELRFRTVLAGAALDLQDVEVTADSLRFDVVSGDSRLSFEGKAAAERLEGRCVWGEQRFSWSATRPGAVEFFEPGLAPIGPFPRADGDLGPIDPEALRALAREAEDTDSSALVVIRDGTLLCDRTFGKPRVPIEAMSATKSVVSLAVGLALDEGALDSLDQPVHELYEEWDDEAHRAITIRHLLTHTSGLAANRTTEKIYASPSFVDFALEAAVKDPPGSVFFYNNRATNLLPGVVEMAVGTSMVELLQERLFEPMGIDRFGWTLDKAGSPHGMAGLQIQALDLAKIGQLMLDGGVWKGEALLPESWIEQSLTAAVAGGRPTRVGLLWWLTRSEEGHLQSYSARGFLGQFLVVVPAHRLVAVRQRQHPGMNEPGNANSFVSFETMVHALVEIEDE